MRANLPLSIVLAALLALAPAAFGGGETPLAATYSIVARDAESGDFGIGVQSHYFGVGPVVPWAESGVGAVATQSLVNIAFGPQGLDLLRQGESAEETLQILLAGDEGRDQRQVAIVDAEGRVAVWTGARCIPAAGHLRGDGYSVQANLVAGEEVWRAMGTAFEEASGPLAERLVAALEAAEAAGGDRRGRQSAALLVVRGTSTGEIWQDRLVDLRVDDHPQPLAELGRLLRLQRAYEAMARASAAAESDPQAAAAALDDVRELAPLRAELLFWPAAALFAAGHETEALPLFEEVFTLEPRWIDLIGDLPGTGLFPDDPEAIQRILERAPALAGAAER